MQVVIAIPESSSSISYSSAADLLMWPVCGVPLLKRTVAMAARSRADEVLIVWPQSVAVELAVECMSSDLLREQVNVRLIRVKSFDPLVGSSWTTILDQLEDRFIWLPWNWVTNKQSLACLPLATIDSADWQKPAYIVPRQVASDEASAALRDRKADGVAVISPTTVRTAERFLVAHSGKVLDGIHTSFNRRLCRPFVRGLSHTPITPNQVTLGGVLVSVISFFAFAHGTYWSYVTGALLFFIAGLFDEMDGMLARIKFADSAFGTWFEGFADGLGYLLLFGGITIGLYRQHGSCELWVGAALLVGTALSLVITSLGRMRGTTSDRRHEYLGTLYQKMESDSSNWISRVARQIQPFQKRGVCIHYIVLFTVLGGVPVLFYLSTLGSHLMWTLSLYFNHRFFKRPAQITRTTYVDGISELR
jgi:phosphatidylglycerophosphate synthase